MYRIGQNGDDALEGGLRITLRDASNESRNLQLRVFEAKNPNLAVAQANTGTSNTAVVDIDESFLSGQAPNLVFSVSGLATKDAWNVPYAFVVERRSPPRSMPRITGIVDTTISQNDTLLDMFTIAYDATHRLTWTVTSSDTTVIPLSSITVLGNGARRVLSIVPRENAHGTSTVSVQCSDTDHVSSISYRITVARAGEPLQRVLDPSMVRTAGLNTPNDVLTVSIGDEPVTVDYVFIVDATGRAVALHQPDDASTPTKVIRCNTSALATGYYQLHAYTNHGIMIRQLPIVE
jgi:hypothetical protein